MICLVFIYSSLNPLDSLGYQINRHSMLCGCKALLLSSGIWAHAMDPNTHRFDTSDLCPKYASKGVFPFIDECGTLFWIYSTACMASIFQPTSLIPTYRWSSPWETDSSFPLHRSAEECRELNVGNECQFGRKFEANNYWHTPHHYQISRSWSLVQMHSQSRSSF